MEKDSHNQQQNRTKKINIRHCLSQLRGSYLCRRKISKDNALKIVTSHYFGQTYYCSPLWLKDALSFENWTRLRSQHYRALRAAVGDFRKRIPCQELDRICKRATPRQWSNYITSKTAIKLFRSYTRIAQDLRNSAYINDRMPKRATFRDSSRLKIGSQQFKNRLQHMNVIKSDWLGDFSEDYIRQKLKQVFFKHILCSSVRLCLFNLFCPFILSFISLYLFTPTFILAFLLV